MKAVLQDDMIVRVGNDCPVEIGRLPKGVGQERLRFDGKQVVDLADLSEIWVRPVGRDFFELHAVEVEGAQLVAMDYRSRKHLVMDVDGAIRLRTMAEILDREKIEKRAMAKTRLRQRLAAGVGDLPDQLADTTKLVLLLVEAVARTGQEAKQALKDLREFTADIYPVAEIKEKMPGRLAKMKQELEIYREEIEG